MNSLNSPPEPSVKHFNELADHWWDPQGPLKTLHQINPFRLQYIRRRCDVSGARVLDVGCGGGLLTEALARYGSAATGIDLAADSIAAAKAHAQASDLHIDYQAIAVESFVSDHSMDVITCMELLEHVDNPQQLIQDCLQHAAPGADCFFSTINRTPKAFALAIVGAEYLTGMIPKGTHQYAQFIKPSELAAMLRAAGATIQHIQGFHYAALTGNHRWTNDVSINYIVHAKKDAIS